MLQGTEGSTNISPHAFYLWKQHTQRNHMPNIFETARVPQNVIVRSLTNPGRSLKNTAPYNCQRQKTLLASAYAAMGLRHFAGSTLLSDFQTISGMKRTSSGLYIQASARWSFIRHGPQGNGIMIITGTIPCQTASDYQEYS